MTSSRVNVQRGPMRKSMAKKAGLTLSVSRVGKMMQRRKVTKQTTPKAKIYATAILEYLASELLEMAAQEATDAKKKRIVPRHIRLAVGRDKELLAFLGNVPSIAQGGTMPTPLHLLTKTKAAKASS